MCYNIQSWAKVCYILCQGSTYKKYNRLWPTTVLKRTFFRSLYGLYMVFYQLLSIVNLNNIGFLTSTNCDQLNLKLSSVNYKQLREDFKKKTAYFMTSGKKVGGPKTKTKFQKNIRIWTRSQGGQVKGYNVIKFLP